MLISDKADIHPSASLAEGVSIGPWTCIGPNVTIGKGTRIDSHVVIQQNTSIGANNVVHSYAMLGGDPQDASYERGHPTWLEMGDNNQVREHVSIHRGSLKGDGYTRIGSNNLIFVGSHIAHDCQVGNHTTFFNHATLGGHCHVDDRAVLSAFCALHQFCRVGRYAFLARGAASPKDIAPYMLVNSEPLRPCGLNLVALKRAGFSSSLILQLKRAYRVLCRQQLTLPDALNELKAMSQETPEIQCIVDFFENSTRGVVR